MNREAAGFNFIVKNCSFEQISILRTASQGLRELGVMKLGFKAFCEALRISGDDLDERFEFQEKETIFKIMKVKGSPNKGSIEHLEELCDYIENTILKEETELDMISNSQDLFKLDEVNLGFDSGSEDGEDYQEMNGLLLTAEEQQEIDEFKAQNDDDEDFLIPEEDSLEEEGSSDDNSSNADAGEILETRPQADTDISAQLSIQEPLSTLKMDNSPIETLETVKKTLNAQLELLKICVENLQESTSENASSKPKDDAVLEDTLKLSKESQRSVESVLELLVGIDNYYKVAIRQKEDVEFRMRGIELENRNHIDLIEKLSQENEQLLRIIEDLEGNQEGSSSLKLKLDEKNLEFAKERTQLSYEIQKLKTELVSTSEKLVTRDEQVKSLREDMSLLKELNDQKLAEIEEGAVGKSKYFNLNDNFEKVKKNLKEKDEQIDKVNTEKQALKDEIAQTKDQLRLEENHQRGLKSEIDILTKANLELEERVYGQKMGKYSGKLGLSKFELLNSRVAAPGGGLGGANRFSTTTRRQFGGLKNINDIGESKIDNSQIGLLRPKASVFGMRSSIRKSYQVGMGYGKMSVGIRQYVDQEFTFRRDYLNISNNRPVILTLKRFGEKEPNGACMSDYIYVYDNKMRRKRMRLVITMKTLLVFTGTGKWTIKRRYSLPQLKEVIIPSKDFTWALLRFKKGFDLLIESYRRLDIILYILEYIKLSDFPPFKVIITEKFEPKEKALKPSGGVARLLGIGQKKKAGFIEETYRNAVRRGFLSVYKKKLFGKSFREYFFVLSNLGLIYFNNYGDHKAKGFIPIYGCNVKQLTDKLTITVKNKSKETFKLKALSELDSSEWVQAILAYQSKSTVMKEEFSKLGK